MLPHINGARRDKLVIFDRHINIIAVGVLRFQHCIQRNAIRNAYMYILAVNIDEYSGAVFIRRNSYYILSQYAGSNAGNETGYRIDAGEAAQWRSWCER